MKEFRLSEKEIIQQFSDLQNLGEIIQDIETSAKASNAVVCEITVNGMLLHESDETRFKGTRTSEIKELFYKTQEIENLVVESIASVLSYLSKLTESAIGTSEKLRLGEWEEAHRNLNAVVSGTEWVVDMLSQIRMVDKKAATLDLDWKELDADFLNSTKGLLEAFEKSDYVLVADLLEYDWSNSLEKWLSLVNRLASLHIGENEITTSGQTHQSETDQPTFDISSDIGSSLK
jgi:hypothetical protein